MLKLGNSHMGQYVASAEIDNTASDETSSDE